MADAKKQNIEYIGITVLVIVALIIGITRFRKKDKDDEIFSRTEFNKKWEEVEVLEAKVPEEEKDIRYPSEVKRLPFKSPFEKEKAQPIEEVDVTLPSLEFQGMVWNSVRPQVIIDNKVYDIEDTIEVGSGDAKAKIKIKDITRDGVYLRYKAREFIVKPK